MNHYAFNEQIFSIFCRFLQFGLSVLIYIASWKINLLFSLHNSITSVCARSSGTNGGILNNCSMQVRTAYRNCEWMLLRTTSVASRLSFNETCVNIYIHIFVFCFTCSCVGQINGIPTFFLSIYVALV